MTDEKSIPPQGRRLVCPYCGDDFEVQLEYTTMSYSEHRDLKGYECGNFECGAEWDQFGDVRTLTKLKVHP